MEYKGFEIVIEQDDCASLPREWDNLGTILTKDSFNEVDNYIVEYVQEDVRDGRDVAEALEEHFGEIAVVLPIYKYQHSTVAYSTRSFVGRAHHAQWDSGVCGFIFVTKETARKEYGYKNVAQKLKDKIAKVLEGEVEEISQYASGDVWGYDIPELDDSCWGFYGYDYCLQEAKSIIDAHIKRTNAAPETRQPVMELLGA